MSCCYLSEERVSQSGDKAGDFHLKLRGALKGFSLTHITQVENERIIILEFSAPTSAGTGEGRRLVLELFSVAGNCYLLDDKDRILTVMHPAAARGRNRMR